MPRGDDRRDPLIALRIPPALDQRLRAEAADTGTSLSEIVRDAIENRFQAEPRRSPATVKAKRGSITVAMCEHRVHAGNYCRRCNRTI